MIHAAEARQLIAACRDHQERLDRIQALTRLLAAIVTAERRIETRRDAGLPASRPYNKFSRAGGLG
jgi:hypothetical protein